MGRAARRRPTGRPFCCIGCSVAFRLAGDGGREGGSAAASQLARLALGVGLSMIVMLIQWVRYVEPEAAADPSYARFAPWAQLVAATPVVLVLGVPYLWNAARWLREGRIGTDLLVGVGILAGYGASIVTMAQGKSEPLFFDTAAGLATLVTLGRWIEASAKAQATAGLRAFLSDAERPATRLGDGAAEEAIRASDLAVGDRVRVRPGEKVPADGTVLRGEALLDEAALTGEPLPRTVGPGDPVHAPTVPLDGPLELEITATATGGLLAQVGRVLERARADRAPLEQLADRIAAVFVPLVLLLAVGVLARGLAAGTELSDAVLHAVSVLVVACPCALGIATPLATTAALGRLAERGILVRSGAVLADLPRVRAVAFDKTGTLTEGRPELGGVHAIAARSEDEALALAASVEAHSEHPWGRAIVDAARARGLDVPQAEGVRVHAGRGIEGRVDTPTGVRTVRVGSGRWLGAGGDGRGQTHVEVDGVLTATVTLEDRLRPSAPRAVRDLRDRGVSVSVLSGDAQATVEGVAAALGLPASAGRGGLLPDEKVAAVRALAEAERGPVAFVGDGLNDAPALAAADLGIAVGSGTDLARETADASLLGDDLSRIPALLDAARRTRRAVLWNLLWAFLYNLVAIVWAVAFGLPPLLAALAMILSSLFVVGNSARLRSALAEDLGPRADPSGESAARRDAAPTLGPR